MAVPSVRTIGRVLARQALVTRRGGPYVPPGTRYPVVPAAYAGAVHQTDFVGPYALRAQGRFYSLHSVDVATARCAVEPLGRRAAQDAIDAVWASCTRLGIPAYQQLDNESVFYGSHLRPRGLGPVLRLCLSAAVEPWFIPIGEPWRNGIVERFNGWWHQRGPLRLGPLGSVAALRAASWAFEAHHNAAYRSSKLAGRTPNAALAASDRRLRFPATPTAPRHPLARPEQGRYHVVRPIRGSPGSSTCSASPFRCRPRRTTIRARHGRCGARADRLVFATAHRRAVVSATLRLAYGRCRRRGRPDRVHHALENASRFPQRPQALLSRSYSSVNDVLAHRAVNDVLAFTTLGLPGPALAGLKPGATSRARCQLK